MNNENSGQENSHSHENDIQARENGMKSHGNHVKHHDNHTKTDDNDVISYENGMTSLDKQMKPRENHMKAPGIVRDNFVFKKFVYSDMEKMLLVDLVERFPDIESRRTDKLSVKRKDQAWEELTREFNAACLREARTRKSLQKLWQNLKSKSRNSELVRLKGECERNGVSSVRKILLAAVSTSDHVPYTPADHPLSASFTNSANFDSTEPPFVEREMMEKTTGNQHPGGVSGLERTKSGTTEDILSSPEYRNDDTDDDNLRVNFVYSQRDVEQNDQHFSRQGYTNMEEDVTRSAHRPHHSLYGESPTMVEPSRMPYIAPSTAATHRIPPLNRRKLHNSSTHHKKRHAAAHHQLSTNFYIPSAFPECAAEQPEVISPTENPFPTGAGVGSKRRRRSPSWEQHDGDSESMIKSVILRMEMEELKDRKKMREEEREMRRAEHRVKMEYYRQKISTFKQKRVSYCCTGLRNGYGGGSPSRANSHHS